MKCETSDCGRTAVGVVHWPGKPLRMCLLCAERAVSIGEAMGFTPPLVPMEEDSRGLLERDAKAREAFSYLVEKGLTPEEYALGAALAKAEGKP